MFGSGWRKISVVGMSVLVVAVASSVILNVSTDDLVGAAGCTQGSTLNIVAHEDDDLLFMSPDLLHDITSGRCVRTIFMTAGDSGAPASYWQGRENGMKAAYAKMAGRTGLGTWNISDAGVLGMHVRAYTLVGKPTVSLVFLRLPDGGMDGAGFNTHNFESLQKLWLGSISSISAVDGSASYSKDTLVGALAAMMASFAPDRIHIQDYSGAFGDGDHADHHASAYFARAAHQQYSQPHTLTGYEGYLDSANPANVARGDLTKKSEAFYAYANYDHDVCNSLLACRNGEFEGWLARQYAVGTESGGGTASNSVPSPIGGNLAGLAQVTASSEDRSSGQLAIRAIDGVIDGYPGDYTKEWATVGGSGGSWIKLTWSSARTVGRMVLFDRPNAADQVTAGTLVFSDGSKVAVGTLNNDGTATTVTFSPRVVTSVQFNVTGVANGTANIGLAEIQVY